MNPKQTKIIVRACWAGALSLAALTAIAQSRPESAACVEAPASMTRPGVAVPGCATAVQVADLLAQNGRATDAFGWYLVAAQQGDAHAQERVGSALRPDRAGVDGIATSHQKSMYWLQKAARAGDANARRVVSEIYLSTRSVIDQ
jgi:TPR repeat protein